MSNPFNTLNPANPYNANNMAGFRNIYQTIMNSNNPMQIFQQFAARNPALQPALNMFRQGMTPEQVFNSICQQRGINPQEFLRNITGK
jgi:hypothetical protein